MVFRCFSVLLQLSLVRLWTLMRGITIADGTLVYVEKLIAAGTPDSFTLFTKRAAHSFTSELLHTEDIYRKGSHTLSSNRLKDP